MLGAAFLSQDFFSSTTTDKIIYIIALHKALATKKIHLEC